jgi:hypothetical protein
MTVLFLFFLCCSNALRTIGHPLECSSGDSGEDFANGCDGALGPCNAVDTTPAVVVFKSPFNVAKSRKFSFTNFNWSMPNAPANATLTAVFVQIRRIHQGTNFGPREIVDDLLSLDLPKRDTVSIAVNTSNWSKGVVEPVTYVQNNGGDFRLGFLPTDFESIFNELKLNYRFALGDPYDGVDNMGNVRGRLICVLVGMDYEILTARRTTTTTNTPTTISVGSTTPSTRATNSVTATPSSSSSSSSSSLSSNSQQTTTNSTITTTFSIAHGESSSSTSSDTAIAATTSVTSSSSSELASLTSEDTSSSSSSIDDANRQVVFKVCISF